MKTVYIVEPGAVIRREGERLRVFAAKEARGDVLLHDLGQLVVVGNIVLTPSAMQALLERGVDTVLLGHAGQYRGRITSGASSNVRLRLAQYEKLTDDATAIAVATRFVQGKLANQRALLLRALRRHGPEPRLKAGVVALAASSLRVETAVSLDAVRGCEGSGSAAYFRAFPALLRSDDFRFDGRNRRPPLDPVNAMLSLGYTLLANAVEAAVQIVGLDAHVGALHEPLAGRPSLVCDLMEELRAPVVDALVLAAIHHRVVGPDAFEDVGDGQPVLFRRDGLRAFVAMFERRLERTSTYADASGERSLPWKQIIEAQARRFARSMLGKDEYECHAVR